LDRLLQSKAGLDADDEHQRKTRDEHEDGEDRDDAAPDDPRVVQVEEGHEAARRVVAGDRCVEQEDRAKVEKEQAEEERHGMEAEPGRPPRVGPAFQGCHRARATGAGEHDQDGEPDGAKDQEEEMKAFEHEERGGHAELDEDVARLQGPVRVPAEPIPQAEAQEDGAAQQRQGPCVHRHSLEHLGRPRGWLPVRAI
jgi:hypothetical protein